MTQHPRTVRITLVTDGSSDQVLQGPLDWLLQKYFPCEYTFLFADRIDRHAPLRTKLQTALADYPCDVLLVHRDAELETPVDRLAQMREVIITLQRHCVRIVPVRMTEAWFLFDEAAIRRAAGRPDASDSLRLPSVSAARLMPDPKAALFRLLDSASGLSGRKLARFQRDHARHYHRICNLVTDFAPLMEVPEFVAFKDELVAAMTAFKTGTHG